MVSRFKQRLILRDGRWTCGYCGAGIEREEMTHEPGCRVVAPVFVGTADSPVGRDHELDLTLDLRELKLRHAAGADCRCQNLAHQVRIFINPEDHRLHRDWECTAPEPDEAALQALHEQAHPDGTVFAENCRERGCVDVGA